MNLKLTLIFLFAVLILKLSSSAQDPHFSQFHNNKLYLNPAFAGSSMVPEFSLSYRNQWPALTGNFVTSMFSYNQYIRQIGGGIGAYSIYDNAWGGTLTSLLFNLVYARHIEIKDVAIQPAITGGYRTRHIDKGRLIFADMIDPRYGFVYYPTPSAPDFSSEQHFFDFGTGLLCYTKNIYAGFSINHLTEPEMAFIRPHAGSELPMKFAYNAGFVIHAGDSDIWTANPDIVFLNQRDFEELMFSLTVKYSVIRAGVGTRQLLAHNSPGGAVIFSLGIQEQRIAASYSYDLSTSTLGSEDAGSHEISLSYRIANKSGKEKKIALDSVAF